MGGLPCAKEIIDTYNRMVAAGACMVASIQLAAVEGRQPTEKQRDDFQKVAEAAAKEMARVEKAMREGGAGDGYGD